MKKYILSIFLITILYSESITIYSTESARYISNSGNSCCTPYILTGYNQSSMYLSTCGTNNYGQCWGTIAAAIWKFDLSTLPNNIEIVTANFEYEYDQSLCTGGIINTSNYNGNIVDDMAYDLWHTPDWEDNIWSSVECNPNDGIHIANIDLSQIINGFQTGQINILRAWGDDASIDNSGINAPRLVIEYEIEISECLEMNVLECGNDNSCEWVEDIETGNCGNLWGDDCELNPECNWNCDFVDDYMGWCNYSCDGGPYEIDNSYCQEIEMPECSDLLTESNCNHLNECEWVENIETEWCSGNNQAECYAQEECHWYPGGIYLGSQCTGGSYEVDNSYCEETEVLECSGMNESQCNNDNLCEWIIDYEWSTCSNYNSASSCSWANDNGGNCDWSWNSTQWQDTCSGGSFQLDLSYCEESEYQLGDLNQDSTINIQDVIIVINLILNGEFDLGADLNLDNTVNVLDVIQLVNIILNN